MAPLLGEGIPVLLVIFPYAEQLPAEATTLPQAKLRALARPLGIFSLDLLAPLRTAAGGGPVFLDSCHLNPRGSRAAARALASWLLDFTTPPGEGHESPYVRRRHRR